jgi:hypothetical protein
MNTVEMVLDSKIRKIAKDHGIKDIYWGSGYPVEGPHMVAICKDWLSGEGYGYNVFVRPFGSGKEQKYFSVVPD